MVVAIRISLRGITTEEIDELSGLKSALPVEDDKPYREIHTINGRYPTILEGTGKSLLRIPCFPVKQYRGIGNFVDDGGSIEASYHLVEGWLRFDNKGFELIAENLPLGFFDADVSRVVMNYISSLTREQRLFGGFVVERQRFDKIYCTDAALIDFEDVVGTNKMADTPHEPVLAPFTYLIKSKEISSEDIKKLTGLDSVGVSTAFSQFRIRYGHYSTFPVLNKILGGLSHKSKCRPIPDIVADLGFHDDLDAARDYIRIRL